MKAPDKNRQARTLKMTQERLATELVSRYGKTQLMSFVSVLLRISEASCACRGMGLNDRKR